MLVEQVNQDLLLQLTQVLCQVVLHQQEQFQEHLTQLVEYQLLLMDKAVVVHLMTHLIEE